MNLKAMTATPIVLVITAFLCSRVVLVSLDDPEGPNLLVIALLALVIYFAALLPFRLVLVLTHSIGPRRILLGFLVQVVIAGVLYFALL